MGFGDILFLLCSSKTALKHFCNESINGVANLN